MGVNIPPRPPEFNGDPKDPLYQKKLVDWQTEMTLWQMAVQAAQNEQQREQNMASNMQKSAHEALMAVVNNLR
ncbi:hypothetical protein [Thermogemmatispora sp.]|uniref:hypothetical protein n=1 Tax=Thermogemmatispora sp. TaxID=1968838 RepID=UPI0035E4060B